ncbi:MAG: 4-hydroxy-tetrahydrodipicolinate synthase [Cyclobacteriaceae bacterium]|jgi:4-hydroxy-tetrahydrodipicolinate synthase
MESNFVGTGVALVTPFNEDYSIDYLGLEKVLNHMSEGGIDYLVVAGTTGEPSTMSDQEKLDVLKFVKAHNPKGLPVVFGIGGNNTFEQIEKYKLFEEEVDAFLSTSPYYNRPSQAGIQKHYELIADSSSKPVFIYNVPGRTASNVEVATSLALSQHPNILGLKEASGDLIQCMAIAAKKPKDFLLISGDDGLAVPMISIGASGLVSVVANAFPFETSQMVNSALAGNFKKASLEAFELIDPIDLSFTEGSPSGVKYIMECLGICNEHVRLPLTPPSAELKARIETYVSGLS